MTLKLQKLLYEQGTKFDPERDDAFLSDGGRYIDAARFPNPIGVEAPLPILNDTLDDYYSCSFRR